MNRRKFDLVLFDCDGVLVDSEPIACAILREEVAKLGWRLSDAEVRTRFIGKSMQSTLDVITSAGCTYPADFPSTLLARELEAFRDALKPMHGIVELLEALDDQPKCVASSSSPERISVSLDVSGLARFFRPEYIFSAEQVEHGKPAPDLFLHAAEMCGADPLRCAVVEDSIAGVQAGIAAGMTVFGLAGSFPAEALESHGARVVVEPRALAPRFQRGS